MILKAFLKKRYDEIRTHHEKGASGEEITAALNDLTDEAIDRVYREVLSEVSPDDRWKVEDGVAVVALGGYGRGERSPHSDIDIMFLFRPSVRREMKTISGGILKRLWDAGFEIGHSTRTISDCVTIGGLDITVKTSLMEARYLNGSRKLFDRFRIRFHRKVVLRNPGQYAREKFRGREADLEHYGTTTYLLEPNLKKSRGGLRDIHLLQWLSLVRHQTSSLETLKRQGLLAREDFTLLTASREFLWRVRNEMHFHAGKAQDTLTFDEQVRLARKWGYRDEGHLLGVEQFMRRYYDHTTAIAEITGRYISGMMGKRFGWKWFKGLFRRSAGEGLEISNGVLYVLPKFRNEIFSSGWRILDLFYQAQIRKVSFSNEIENRLTSELSGWTKDFFQGSEVQEKFFAILSNSSGISKTLRDLHRFHVLECLIPGLSRVRALMQFNQYHKYTVDEHSLRAVEEAEKLSFLEGPVSIVHREIANKPVLYLALLSHDLGKGMVAGEHSEQGADIARETASRLGLDPASTETLIFLVREHLVMTHVATRRDISDPQVLAQFADKVGDEERLRILYILTLADITAVGPGMLTAWKKDLLRELFIRTMKVLTGDHSVISEDQLVRKARETVTALCRDGFDPAWVEGQLNIMTQRYLLATIPERILVDLERIRGMDEKSVLVFTENDSTSNLTEYCVYAREKTASGIFYKITSVLSAMRLQIIGAEIQTWQNGIVVDRFRVSDPDFKGPPGDFRLRAVREAIVRTFETGEVPNLSSGMGRYQPAGQDFPKTVPVRVVIDNETSDRYTVVEVFAPNRPGLLARMAEILFKEELSVQAARVATQLDQVVDVFHVTDRAGQRIVDPDKIRIFTRSFTEQIENFIAADRIPERIPTGSNEVSG